MDSDLRLHPGQEKLTPAQEPEARRFAQERIEAQLSTAPVDEPETEQLLRQAYVVAGLPPPRQIGWIDGPLHFVAQAPPRSVWDRIWRSTGASMEASVWNSMEASVGAYGVAPKLAAYRFFDEYSQPNDAHALAHFNERVSGYWLGQEQAIIVRRPRVLARDAARRRKRWRGIST